MQTANDRLELLKWVSSNIKKVERLQVAIGKIADKIVTEPVLQDIEICSALNKLQHLGDRMDYLNTQIDSQYFVNEGQLELKEKKS